MDKRPTSLTIIAWLLIIGAVFSVISTFTMQSNPMALKMMAGSPLPVWAHQAFAFLGAVVITACGYGVLKGLSWSRLLYIGWSGIALLFNLMTVPIISILAFGVLFLAVMAFFLFRPAANAWFARDGRVVGQE